MSWNKNTLNLSNLDAVKSVLEDFKIPHTLQVMETVRGRGLNDDMFGIEERCYELRRLTYRGFTILEQMQQAADCDTDDVIISQKFTKEDEPRDWKYVVKEEE